MPLWLPRRYPEVLESIFREIDGRLQFECAVTVEIIDIFPFPDILMSEGGSIPPDHYLR